jgi:hypothetical protein
MYFFEDSPPFTSVYVDIASIFVIGDFYKMETVRFNITCQFNSLFTVKERNQILPFVALLSRHFRVPPFSNFLSVGYGRVNALNTLRMATTDVQTVLPSPKRSLTATSI